MSELRWIVENSPGYCLGEALTKLTDKGYIIKYVFQEPNDPQGVFYRIVAEKEAQREREQAETNRPVYDMTEWAKAIDACLQKEWQAGWQAAIEKTKQQIAYLANFDEPAQDDADRLFEAFCHEFIEWLDQQLTQAIAEGKG